MDVILHNEPGRGHSFAATVPCGYTVKHRMIHAHDRIPTVGVDKYGTYAANPHLWGTMDELYLTGFGKPNHPVPALKPIRATSFYSLVVQGYDNAQG